MKRRLVLTVFFACMATFAAILPSFASAQSAPAAEKQKIEALIKQVGDLKTPSSFATGGPMNPQPQCAFCAASEKPTMPKSKPAGISSIRLPARPARRANPT
jgi:hypothetical protein